MNYQNKNDFKEIRNCFLFDGKAQIELQNKLSEKTILRLEKIKGKVFKERRRFTEEIAKILDLKTYRDNEAIISGACDLGRRRFQEKLGWVKRYEEDLVVYSQILELVKILFQQVKNQGLNTESPLLFESNIKNLNLRKRCEEFKNKIVEYLLGQTGSLGFVVKMLHTIPNNWGMSPETLDLSLNVDRIATTNPGEPTNLPHKTGRNSFS